MTAFEKLQLPSGVAVFDSNLIDAKTASRALSVPIADLGQPLPGAAGRTGVRLIEHLGRRWVRRHNVRGGWVGRFVRDSYLWLGEKRTRTLREFALLSWMHRQGLPVPAPVVAGYCRRGLRYRCDLLTSYLDDTMTLGARLACGPLNHDGWQAVGNCIRRFHDHGICHPDLNAHNILLHSDGRVFLVDFDRGSRRRAGPWVQRNWERLHRSLRKLGHTAPTGLLGPATDPLHSSLPPRAAGARAYDAVPSGGPVSDHPLGQ